jgi:hypothetical protein
MICRKPYRFLKPVKAYFDLSRNGAYAAAKRGDIPTIKIGKLLRVPIRALEQKLDASLKTDAA